jgi:predicted small secreted protein
MNKKSIKFFMMMLALVGTSAVVSACNTVEGAGEDISAAGNAIESSAQKHSP